MNIEVRGAPSYYACEAGVLHKLGSLLEQNGLSKGVVIHGEKSWKAITPYFPKDIPNLSLTYASYRGECSKKEVMRISNITLHAKSNVIIGVGGGKILDIAKAVGNETGLDVVLIPTLASTCAAWTPLSVFYDDSGSFTHYTVFPRSSLYVLVEPRVLLGSPTQYLIAGIADTLAKWYEADVLIRDLIDPPIVVTIAHQAAKLCKDTFFEHSVQAVQDLKNNNLSPSLIKVIETNIVAGGMVGGYGDEFGRISGAHAVHNGLTIREETHHLLHGEKVAYGVLIQLVLEENFDEIQKLLPLYEKLELPYRLEHMGLHLDHQKALHTIAEAIVKPSESIHLMKGTFTPEKLYQAFLTLEAYINKQTLTV